jgi:hypothetical protein
MSTRDRLMFVALAALWLAGCGSSTSLGVDGASSLGADGSVDALAPVNVDGGAPADQIPPASDLPGSSVFALTWTLQWFGSSAPITCQEAGTPTVILRATGDHGQVTEERFPCADQRGLTRPLVPGSYGLQLVVQDQRGSTVGLVSWTAPLIAGQLTDLGMQGFELQSFTLPWSLARAGKSVTCAEAGAQTVELVSRHGQDAPITYSFPCMDGVGSTPAIQMGKYDLEVRLLNATGKVLWQSNPMTFDVEDEGRAALPPVLFDLGP